MYDGRRKLLGSCIRLIRFSSRSYLFPCSSKVIKANALDSWEEKLILITACQQKPVGELVQV